MVCCIKTSTDLLLRYLLSNMFTCLCLPAAALSSSNTVVVFFSSFSSFFVALFSKSTCNIITRHCNISCNGSKTFENMHLVSYVLFLHELTYLVFQPFSVFFQHISDVIPLCSVLCVFAFFFFQLCANLQKWEKYLLTVKTIIAPTVNMEKIIKMYFGF